MAEMDRLFPSLVSFSGDRYRLLEHYRRLEDSVRQTLMPAFGNIEQRLSAYADELNAQTYEADDPSFQESEHKAWLHELFADDLRATQSDMAGMAVVALYHHWERSVKWMIARKAGAKQIGGIDSADFVKLKALLGFDDLPDDCRQAFDYLDLGRLIANVIKHGEGKSADNLRDKAPDLFVRPWNSEHFELPSEHGVNMIWVQPKHVDFMANAIARFWETLPDDRFPTMRWSTSENTADFLNGTLD